MAEFQAVYTQLWGEPATEAYLKNLINKGFNRWEMEDFERSKPAFARTETYREEASNLAELLGNMGVLAAERLHGKRGGKGDKPDKPKPKPRSKPNRPDAMPDAERVLL